MQNLGMGRDQRGWPFAVSIREAKLPRVQSPVAVSYQNRPLAVSGRGVAAWDVDVVLDDFPTFAAYYRRVLVSGAIEADNLAQRSD